jgi:hypothetical protein
MHDFFVVCVYRTFFGINIPAGKLRFYQAAKIEWPVVNSQLIVKGPSSFTILSVRGSYVMQITRRQQVEY